VVAVGLALLNEDGSDGTLIANAIITVSIDDGKQPILWECTGGACCGVSTPCRKEA
jgi:hypothetical protein